MADEAVTEMKQIESDTVGVEVTGAAAVRPSEAGAAGTVADASSDTEVTRLKGLLSSAVARYRESLLAGSPEVPAEMVSGETVEEVEASLGKARAMVARVRERLSAQEGGVRVPAGPPPRRPPDLSALSPREKIDYGLGRMG